MNRLYPFFPAAFVVLALAGPLAAADAPKKATPTPGPAQDVPIYDVDADGKKTLEYYQKLASESGRRLLINFGVNDCAPCRTTNSAIHEKKFFDPFILQFVPAYIDVSSGTNAVLVNDYHISPRADLPAIVILMPDGRVIETLAHGEMAAIARKGEEAVRDWFYARFLKNDK
jgi:hypothetical protein